MIGAPDTIIDREDLFGTASGESGWSGGGEGRRRAWVVVGVDARPTSIGALRTAMDLAGRIGAELAVVHAIDLRDFPVDPDSDDWEAEAQRNIQSQEEIVRAVMTGWDRRWLYRAIRGEPIRVLNGVAAQLEALMIVVGARDRRHRHDWGGWADHSIPHRLVGHAERPVLVVPAPVVAGAPAGRSG